LLKNLMLNVRDLDPAEGECVNASATQVVKWQDERPQLDIRTVLNRLRQDVTEVAFIATETRSISRSHPKS